MNWRPLILCVVLAVPQDTMAAIWARDSFVGAELSWHFTDTNKLGGAVFVQKLWSVTSFGNTADPYEAFYVRKVGAVLGPKIAVGYHARQANVIVSLETGISDAVYCSACWWPILYRPVWQAAIVAGYRIEIGKWNRGPLLGAELACETAGGKGQWELLPWGSFAAFRGELWRNGGDEAIEKSIHLSFQTSLVLGESD